MWHDLIRWADDLRHYLASSLNAQAVGGNTGAAVYWALGAAIISYMVWPKVREKVNGWMKRHTETASAELHAKLDHIIAHHPDIPDFPSKSPGS